MLKHNARIVDVGLRAFDLLVLAVAFPLGYEVRDHLTGAGFGGLYPIAHYWPLLALTFLLWLAASTVSRVYDAYRTRPVRVELWRLARAMVIVALSITALGFVLKEHDVSRLFVALYFAIALGLLLANRVVVRLVAHSARRRGRNTRRYLVVGSGPAAEAILEHMAGHPEWGFQLAGFVLDDDAGPAGVPGPVLGRLSELGAVLTSHVVDEVFFALGRHRMDSVAQAIGICEELGVGAKVYADFFQQRIARVEVEDLDGAPMLSFTTVPGDPLALLAKRAFDVAVSGAAVALLSPLLLAVSLAIVVDSPGPVLFRQRRVGRNGREFWLYKFRSMRADAEAHLARLRDQNEADGPVFKMRNDPRITRVGRFLRKTSIDELPQFWNVLRGDMSVVGPRPPIPSEVREYHRWQRRRLSMRPGITCIWQISGRSDVKFDRWMELDLQYIDNWSFWDDLKIVFKTIPVVLIGKGAR